MKVLCMEEFEMDYVNQDVVCPKCGQCIAFDDFDDCYDTNLT